MKISVFGTGSAFKDFHAILPDDHEIVAIADSDPDRHGEDIDGYPIIAPAALVEVDAELVVITARATKEIRAQLLELGIPAEKIVAYYVSYDTDLGEVLNTDINRLNEALGTNIPLAGVATMYLWPETGFASRSGVCEDFVRRHAMRLAASWINDREIKGSIAELGVYQGEQAELLNMLFPDRTIHLFDTFEGFAPADVATEAVKEFSGAALGDFQDTSIERVLARMPNAAKVKVYPGMFPGTLKELEDEFSFVSLDVDLYEPTLAGLDYFYPRLMPGGFIFVHDFNNRRYSGVRHAVEEFLARNHAPTIPLPDFAGTLVVLK